MIEAHDHVSQTWGCRDRARASRLQNERDVLHHNDNCILAVQVVLVNPSQPMIQAQILTGKRTILRMVRTILPALVHNA